LDFSSRVQAPCGSSLFTDPWMEGRIRLMQILKRRHAGSEKIQREPRSIEIVQAFSKPRAK